MKSFLKTVFPTVLSVVLSVSLFAAPAVAKPALRDVPEIDDALMAVAIADEIRKSCDDIHARMIRALTTLNRLKSLARDKGYSKEEVEKYVTSKAEKARMREKAEAFLVAQGVSVSQTSSLCTFGKQQIAAQSDIGRLLR